MRKKRIRIILIVIIALFILGMAFFPTLKKNFTGQKEKPVAVAAEKKQGKKDKPLNVNVKVLKYESLEDVVRTTGNLLPDEEVNLSFETSGKITRIYFKEGSQVKKGDLLAKVNDLPLQAELKKLETQLPLAKDRVFRQKSLLEKDAVSQEAYEQVNTELEKLYADIDLVKSRIAQTELRAPFEGVIGLRLVSEGAYVSSAVSVARLTKISPLKIEFSINERQASQVGEGTKLKFRVQDDLKEYIATVYAVESQVDMSTRTLSVRATYPNPDRKLKPGRSASVEIQLRAINNTLTAPAQAVIAEMGRDIAYIYKNGKAQQVVLSKGLRTESKLQILDGVSVGDTLIVNGVMQLRDGMPVVIDHVE